MMWIPFRMNTVYIKKIYFCPDLLNCEFHLGNYQNDIVLGIMFFIGYVYLTIGLLRKFQRQALAFTGRLRGRRDCCNGNRGDPLQGGCRALG
jgi:hypothetical protein